MYGKHFTAAGAASARCISTIDVSAEKLLAYGSQAQGSQARRPAPQEARGHRLGVQASGGPVLTWLGGDWDALTPLLQTLSITPAGECLSATLTHRSGGSVTLCADGTRIVQYPEPLEIERCACCGAALPQGAAVSPLSGVLLEGQTYGEQLGAYYRRWRGRPPHYAYYRRTGACPR